MPTLRSFLAAFAVALSTGSALAAPVLKADIVVTAPIVTVGDMFDDAGILAEQPLFRSPRPGTTGHVDLAAVRSATARIGLTRFEVNGLAQVRVSRAAATVDAAMLEELIRADLRARGILTPAMQANAVFARPVEPIQVAAEAQPARLESLRYLPGSGSFSARFVLAGIDRPLEVGGTMELAIEAPHLAAALPAGTLIEPHHVVMRAIPLAQADALGVAGLDQLVGMTLNRQSREGMLLRASDVSVPLAVAKNDLVTIYYRQGPLTLTVKGQAVTGAAEGGPVQVLNLMSRRVISATAIAPGAVQVSAGPVALAGL